LGDDIFASLDAVVLSARNGINIQNINKNMENILVELSEIEKKFFEPIPSDVIAKAIGLPITEATFYLSELLKAGLISQLLSVKSNTRYLLSDSGRRFIIERGIK
jgi:hypothetical protein